MKRQEIDEIVRHKLNKHKMPPEHIWKNIENALDNTGKTVPFTFGKWQKVAGLAAGLIIAVAATVWIVTDNNNTTNQKSIVHQQIEKSDHNANPLNNSNAKDHNTNATLNNKPAILVNNTKTTFNTNPNVTSVNPNFIERILNNEADPVSLFENEKREDKSDLQNVFDKKLPPDWVPAQGMIAHNEQSLSMLPENHIVKENSKHNNEYQHDLEMGFVGGYNYGTLQSGVSMTVNVKKNFNSKIYFDGGVGLLVNNASDNLHQFNGDFLQFKSRPISQISSRPINQYRPANQLYYLQLNPTIGYSITPNLALSVGPDYQFMMTNPGDVVIIRDDTKLLPKSDFGITTGIEYKIAPNLKAGVKAREGINSFIRNDANVANREYFQLQFKYQLPLD